MSSILKLFEQAQLAEASYAIFARAVYGDQDALKAALNVADVRTTKAEFSTAQATEFAKKYRVIDQYTAPASFSNLGGTGFGDRKFKSPFCMEATASTLTQPVKWQRQVPTTGQPAPSPPKGLSLTY